MKNCHFLLGLPIDPQVSFYVDDFKVWLLVYSDKLIVYSTDMLLYLLNHLSFFVASID